MGKLESIKKCFMNEKCFNNCKELVLFYDASNPRNKYAIDWTDIKWDGIACPVDDVQCDKQCEILLRIKGRRFS